MADRVALRAEAYVDGDARSARPAITSPGILQRAEAFADGVDRITGGGETPLNLVIEEMLGPVEARIHGQPTLLFGTNNYLGLNFHPDCVRAAADAVVRHGTGSTASRVAAGNHADHIKLEAEIAALYGRSYATVFSTGFMANLGVISALAQQGDAIFVDAHSHASIFDACRLSGASISTFRHNDARDLDRLFRESKITPARTLVVLEGLYSVWGDVGDLKSIIAVAKRHGAVVVVDEAHGMGMYGERGRGVSEMLGVEDDVEVIVGTFSKSVGVIGGFAVTDLPALRSLRYMARAYLYTASLPPAVAASARAAVHLIATQPGLRETLWRNARAFHAGLTEIGLAPCAAPGPVGAVKMAGIMPGYAFWRGLLARGVYVNMLIPPATPDNQVVLRFSVSAAHTPAHIETAIAAFRDVQDSFKT
jgi:8-amino-7-oxononanoate synthase